jgi:hypothetical protein
MSGLEKTSRIRSYLLTFTVVLSYMVFTLFGMIVAKYNPWILNFLDLAFIPVGLTIILIMYLFAFTYEKRKQVALSKEVLQAVRLYGEGNSFQKIKEDMGLSHINEVKRMITTYCKER